MKRNRSKYTVYMEPWRPGRHKVFHSKLQMKKFLRRCGPGSEAIKERITHFRDGSWSVGVDRNYQPWVKA